MVTSLTRTSSRPLTTSDDATLIAAARLGDATALRALYDRHGSEQADQVASGKLHPDLQRFYDDLEFKNRVLFLTGERGSLERLLEIAAEFLPATQGIETTALPSEFGPEKNVVWKTDVPGLGNSSPIVAGDRVGIFLPMSPEAMRESWKAV